MSGYLYIVLAQIIWGTVSVFARLAHQPAEATAFFRCLIACAALGLWVTHKDLIRPYLRGDKTFLLLVLSGACITANWVFLFKAVNMTTIASSIFLYNLAPIFVMLSAVLFLREKPTGRQLVCMAVSFGGAALILASKGAGMAPASLKGAGFAVAAGALYAQVTVIGRHLKSVPPVVITFFQTTTGALMLLPTAIVKTNVAAFGWQTLAVVAALGLFNTVLPFILYFKGLKTVDAATAGILQYLYTLSTIVFGYLVFREGMSGLALAGGLVIMVSTFWATRPASKTWAPAVPSAPCAVSPSPLPLPSLETRPSPVRLPTVRTAGASATSRGPTR